MPQDFNGRPGPEAAVLFEGQVAARARGGSSAQIRALALGDSTARRSSCPSAENSSPGWTARQAASRAAEASRSAAADLSSTGRTGSRSRVRWSIRALRRDTSLACGISPRGPGMARPTAPTGPGRRPPTGRCPGRSAHRGQGPGRGGPGTVCAEPSPRRPPSGCAGASAVSTPPPPPGTGAGSRSRDDGVPGPARIACPAGRPGLQGRVVQPGWRSCR